MDTIKLGDKARDTITGYTGIVIARTEWLYGCVRLQIQAQAMKDGTPVESYTVDEPQCEIIEEPKTLPPGFPKPAHGDYPNILRATNPTKP